MKYYHYTPEDRLEEILDSEVIKLAKASTFNKKEKPVAWVSTNQFWEPTATKMWADSNGNYSPMTFEEQLSEFGCARIEVEPVGLYTWAKLIHIARMNERFAYEMEKVGIEKGGRPRDWYGSLTPISINRWIRAEVLRGDKWEEYEVFEWD